MGIDPDHTVLAGMQTVFDVLAATFFFVLCSLPLVTAGASLIAVYDTMAAIAGKRCGGLTRKFFSSFRKNLQPGLRLLALAVAGALTLWLDVYACWGRGWSPPRCWPPCGGSRCLPWRSIWPSSPTSAPERLSMLSL